MSLSSRGHLESRYRFTGKLEFRDTVHVGAGYGDEFTDGAVVRAGGRPIIPGSSIRGAFRSRVERIYGALARDRCCGLYDKDENFGCATVNSKLREKLEEKAKIPEIYQTEAWLKDIDGSLCDVCKLFGSGALWASKVAFMEANPCGADAAREKRHGVGISRNTGAAEPNIKYDHEVLPPGSSFHFEAIVENPSSIDLSLMALGLDQLCRGEISLGGRTGVGFGRCQLRDGITFFVDFRNRASLLSYLQGGYGGGYPLEDFVTRHLDYPEGST